MDRLSLWRQGRKAAYEALNEVDNTFMATAMLLLAEKAKVSAQVGIL